MEEFYWIAIAVIAVFSSARFTRLLTFDKFPPIASVRNWYADRTDGSDWQVLAFCGYCMSVWVTTAVVLWGYYADWNTPWLLVNGISAASYGAAIVMANDGDDT